MMEKPRFDNSEAFKVLDEKSRQDTPVLLRLMKEWTLPGLLGFIEQLCRENAELYRKLGEPHKKEARRWERDADEVLNAARRVHRGDKITWLPKAQRIGHDRQR